MIGFFRNVNKMYRDPKKVGPFFFCLLFFFIWGNPVFAERLRGQIRNISKKSQTIEILDFSSDRYRTFRYDESTYYINARSIDDLFKNEKIEIRFISGKPLKSIKKMLVFVPRQKVMKTGELLKFLFTSEQKVLLFDARPWFEYQKGHLPTAIWLPGERFAQYDHILPEKRDLPIIVYGDGVTSETAPQLARLIELEGYNNVRIYVFGFPAWKRHRQPILVEGEWLIKNLDPNKVIIDVRDREKSLISHIQSAVAFDAKKIINLGSKYRTTKRGNKTGELFSKRILPALPDKKVQIILYGEDTFGEELIEAFQELVAWKYEDVVILKGGFPSWAKSYPVIDAPAKTQIRYERYIAEGAISPKDFKRVIEEASALVLDIRTPQEVLRGMISGALNIPLAELDVRFKELPRSKKIVIYCVNGIRAQIAYTLLKAEGFTQISFLNSAIVVKGTGEFVIPSF